MFTLNLYIDMTFSHFFLQFLVFIFYYDFGTEIES